MTRLRFLLIVAVVGLIGSSEAQAAGPVLVSVGHVQRHPEATWTLPAGADAWTLEIATQPATGSDGSFFDENRVVFEILSRTQTHYLSSGQLGFGTYYLHVSSFNSGCEPTCVEWSQTLELVIERPPPLPPRYQATAKTTHPGAIRDHSRNWTYLGDTVRVAFRNAAARSDETRRYKVCYTRNRRLACANRTLRGNSWDAWRLHIMPSWAGFVNGRYRGYVRVHLASKRARRCPEARLALRIRRVILSALRTRATPSITLRWAVRPQPTTEGRTEWHSRSSSSTKTGRPQTRPFCTRPCRTGAPATRSRSVRKGRFASLRFGPRRRMRTGASSSPLKRYAGRPASHWEAGA